MGPNYPRPHVCGTAEPAHFSLDIPIQRSRMDAINETE